MDRRTTIKWMLAVSAAWPVLSKNSAHAVTANSDMFAAGQGYGTDPALTPPHHAGEFWPLTLSAAQRRLAAVLSDLIIPADEHSGAASSIGVVDFIDEWVSAPYPRQQHDREIVLPGFTWLDAEARRRSGKPFADLSAQVQTAICDEIASEARANPAQREAARFFARYRDLTAAAFYSSPAGRKDVGYIGNVPLTSFEGAPVELLKKLNLI
jgi:gluconate 2-dehydrogenase subunit 3-like protein